MEVVGPEQAELLIARGRLSEAAAELAVCRDDDCGAEDLPERLRASVLATLADDPSLAGAIPPDLLACRTRAAASAYFDVLQPPVQAYDYLTAGVVLAWSMDAAASYDVLREAHARATAEKRFHFAIAARDRLAHQAVLFGDLEIARGALDDAIRLAHAQRLPEWFVRSSAAAARLAFDGGDSGRAAQLLSRAQPHARSPDAVALLAPVGAALAVESADEPTLREWTSPSVLTTALRSRAWECANAATIALLCATDSTPDSRVSIALRRALLRSNGVTGAVELFSLAARHGDLDEARFGADALNALVAPNRKYLKAHALLARAHVLFRCGERAAAVDNAGDAARAFSALGMRRWMNEAMLLLVRQESDNFPRRRRGRPLGSALTGREQQVAHLIRRGARNREVAAALQISEHTVERHVSSILGRLGLRSRWQIVDAKDDAED